ncbi:fumarate reductase subunit A [Clostridium sediminicola]|uniref:FAD-binding protein n=1 Tax=Clostridium sediminicola TaxID=3114879 RepID=UPI0031F1E961
MIISSEYKADVLVVGAGLAGISASIEAARQDTDVVLAVASKFCSGSSFYPGTWGLGMVAPMDEMDKEDFVDSINEVGCGIANYGLSRTLIDHIGDRIDELEQMGVKFKKSDNLEEDNSLIPCFDRKHRKWYGYLFKSAREVFNREIKRLNVNVLENVEIVKLIKHEDKLVAAIGIDENNKFICIYTKAIVLATGGFGGLYKHSLNTSDINGFGQTLALEAGCELVNVEFIQFIPGYLQPSYKTIFNERTFKYTILTDNKGNEILDKYLPNGLDKKVITEERSGHGPFSCRLNTKYVDIAMFKEYLANKKQGGIKVRYSEKIKNSNSLMINEYFKWLKSTKGIDYNDEIIMAPFEHAANGGIRINEKAETGVKGIYAAGEVTGGMHGADRIGGLSTANALVFGKIAGRNAALYAKEQSMELGEKFIENEMNKLFSNGKAFSLEPDYVIEKIKEIMWTNGCIVRREENLKNAITEIKKLERDFDSTYYISKNENIKNAIKAHHFLRLSLVLLNAMLLRKESRGSHYREDYPNEDNELNKVIIISKGQNDEMKYKFS